MLYFVWFRFIRRFTLFRNYFVFLSSVSHLSMSVATRCPFVLFLFRVCFVSVVQQYIHWLGGVSYCFSLHVRFIPLRVSINSVQRTNLVEKTIEGHEQNGTTLRVQLLIGSDCLSKGLGLYLVQRGTPFATTP